ncbi:aldehyde dehydrogenase family protein [Aestuariicella hydrocarbonica]|uniref:Aldehyde dehydrogenase family protein n=1 Tax=Pseudomaricurvus hydrocarbonicus TaxID=1470433 RepID=A0A9E5T3U5_9GAMM|nr:aldehyde dehydrogenase family protein [Aestuariicella hydrocarbonica]NHO67294.1 aldehyde dehydrogenase family protein [Aestuariicella hydrocarbonica]
MKTHEEWQKQALSLTFPSQAYIDGQTVGAVSGKSFDSINPATGQLLTTVAACEQADVDVAVTAARRAFNDGAWSQCSPAERKQVLCRLADLMGNGLGYSLANVHLHHSLVRDETENGISAVDGSHATGDENN